MVLDCKVLRESVLVAASLKHFGNRYLRLRWILNRIRSTFVGCLTSVVIVPMYTAEVIWRHQSSLVVGSLGVFWDLSH
jgi:hypothetical protein